MGLVFEELVRKFEEISNETAGQHFTPRVVIPLLVNLIFVEDSDVLSTPSVLRTIGIRLPQTFMSQTFI